MARSTKRCVNINAPEYKELSSKFSGDPLELEILVSNWQTSRNTDIIPKLAQVQPVDDVQEKLLSVLDRNGITVTSMKDYTESYGLRKGKSITTTALADTTRKIIAVDKGLQNEMTLPEEAMHMATATQKGTYNYNRAIRLVENTDEYAQNYDNYKRIYEGAGYEGAALEEKIRAEILGKIGRKYIVQNLKETTRGTGLGRYIRRIWNKFMSMFKPAVPELEQILDKWANDFVQGNVGEVQDQGVFFEAEAEPLSKGEQVYESIIKGLRNKFKYLKGRDVEKLKEITYEIEDMEYTQGIFRFLQMALEDGNETISRIKKINKGELLFTSRNYSDMRVMLEYYTPHISQIKQYFENILVDEDHMSKPEIKKAVRAANAIVLKLERIERFHREQGVRLSRESAFKEVEASIENSELRKQEKEVIDKSIRKVDYDSNRALYWFGSLVHAKDSFQRILNYSVSRIRRAVDRFTYDLGKELTQLAEEYGIKDSSIFIEKDENGKFQHYFIDKFRTGKFKKAQNSFHTKLHTKYGLPEDKYDRGRIKRQWAIAADAVKAGTANSEQKALAKKLKKYNTEIAKWYAKNTIPKEGWQQIIEDVKAQFPDGGTSPEFQAWKRENVGSHDGYAYPKGELVTPSDGSTITRGEFTTKTNDWTNPDYDKLSEKEVEYLNKLLDVMEKADEKHPRERDRLQLPQVKASTIDLLKQTKFKNIQENLKDAFRDAEDDTEFGDKDKIERPDGSIAQFVPIYFVRKLDNPDQLSPDVISSVIAYSDVMENYKQMSTNVDTFETILDTIGNREVNTGKKQYTGVESEVYKTMKKFIEMNVYGKWKEHWVVGGVNMTKVMQHVVKFVTANNLAFSLYTTLASYFTSATYSKIEDLVGQYTTNKDKLVAEKIWDTNIHHVLLQSGKVNKTNKLGLFFEKHRILKRNQDVFNNLDKSRLTRKALESGLFWSYDLVRLRIRGKLALAVANNYKYYEGKFYTTNELKNRGIEHENLPTYWDMVEQQDGKLIAKHSDPNIEDKIEAKVNYIGANIDGELDYSDWAAAHQGAITQLVTTHRGWMFRNIQLRLKPKGVNYQTGEVEEGFYMSFWEFMRKTFFSNERVSSLKELIARWEKLEPYEKQGVLRTLWEMAFIYAVSTLALIVNNAAMDADDDDLINYMAYQSNRVLLELGVMNPTLVVAVDPFSDNPDANNLALRLPFASNIQEMVAILNSPVAAARQVDTLTDWMDLFSGELVESGPYEDMSRRQRFLIKMTPGAKGIFQARDPNSRNQYLKNKTLNWLYKD